MHLHQELENFYLGMADDTHPHSNGGLTDPAHRMVSRKPRGRHIERPQCTMLILEDFDEIRAFLARHFTQNGYEVFSSSTLRDALALAWEEVPQIIIVDYDLAGERAIHAVERLHTAMPQSDIVLIGGPGTTDVEENATLAGATTVLPKAYAITERDHVIQHALRQPPQPRYFS